MRDFTYIPPTPVTATKHAAIRAAWTAAAVVVGQMPNDDEKPAIFARINDACKAFAEAIVEHAPPSADTAAAIRCVRLARMIANEAVLSPTDGNRLRRLADDELLKARMQASAAIALHDWGTEG